MSISESRNISSMIRHQFLNQVESTPVVLMNVTMITRIEL